MTTEFIHLNSGDTFSDYSGDVFVKLNAEQATRSDGVVCDFVDDDEVSDASDELRP